MIILGHRKGFKNKEQYVQYAPDGEFIKAFIDRPLVLGNYGKERDALRKDIIQVQFPEKTFEIKCKINYDKYFRDQTGDIYVIKRIGDHPQPPDLHMGYVYSDLYYKILRYDFCSTSLSYEYNFPKNEKKVVSIDNTVGYRSEVIVEYGEPVIAPNGNIYAWSRTPDAYSIIKWIWTDGPDVPYNLKTKSTNTEIDVTWETPTEDQKSVTAYEISRSIEVCGSYNPIKEVEKNTLTYVDKEVQVGDTYYYQIRAIRDGQYSGYSNKAVGIVE